MKNNPNKTINFKPNFEFFISLIYISLISIAYTAISSYFQKLTTTGIVIEFIVSILLNLIGGFLIFWIYSIFVKRNRTVNRKILGISLLGSFLIWGALRGMLINNNYTEQPWLKLLPYLSIVLFIYYDLKNPS